MLEQVDNLQGYYEELNMTRESVRRDIASLREWITKQRHLPKLPDDVETDEWLERVLFHTKNRLEKAKSVLNFYFTSKTAVPELMSDRDPCHPDMLYNYKTLYVCPLPKLTPEGYRIAYFGRAVADVDNFNSVCFMKRMLMTADLFHRLDVNRGLIVIFDFNNSRLALWAKYNPLLLAKFVHIMQKAYPYRLKSVSLINAPGFVSSLFPLLSDKIRSRLHVYSSKDSGRMLQLLPPECLPLDLGGTLQYTIQELNEVWWKNLIGKKSWFHEQDQLKADLTKYKENAELDPEMNYLFGSVGSFRSLSID